MYSKNTSFGKTFTTVIKRFFRARNVIIISEHKVDHVPLSAVMQILLLVGVVGFFSGISYITGSFMSARNSLKEKDEKIVSSTMEKTHINEEMDQLKHDLLKLSQNGKELSSYSKFIVDQYANEPVHDAQHFVIAPTAFSADNIFAGNNNQKLNDRISYLEQRMGEIRDENDHLVMAIRDRTSKKINYFEDIIAMTGLDADRLEHMAATGEGRLNSPVAMKVAPAEPEVSAPDASATDENDDEDAPVKKETTHGRNDGRGENEGGPFIPYETIPYDAAALNAASPNAATLNDANRELLENVDRLVLLHDIVEQLPLSQPIGAAQVTGPFGKRVDPLNGRWAIHPGVDLAGPTGAHIVSASAGKVIIAGRRVAYGNAVDIDHGFGIVTRYAHMSKILVHEGQIVAKGQLLGIQGSTGRSTGPHLHFEVRINDRPVNPVKFLHAGEYVLEN